jgi:hypothetical protein
MLLRSTELAFYAQYGIDRIEALVRVIGLYRGEGFP